MSKTIKYVPLSGQTPEVRMADSVKDEVVVEKETIKIEVIDITYSDDDERVSIVSKLTETVTTTFDTESQRNEEKKLTNKIIKRISRDQSKRARYFGRTGRSDTRFNVPVISHSDIDSEASTFEKYDRTNATCNSQGMPDETEYNFPKELPNYSTDDDTNPAPIKEVGNALSNEHTVVRYNYNKFFWL